MSTRFPTTEAALARKAGKALLAETPAAARTKLDVELLALEQIKPGKNPRKHFDQAALEELAASIKARGVLEPILVRSGPGFRGLKHPFELIAGERRLRAARLAGLDKIPARVLELDDKGAAEVRVIENEQREDLSPIEKAEGYQELLDKHGYKVEDLAAKIGKSPGTIYGLLKLRQLPPSARDVAQAPDGRPLRRARCLGSHAAGAHRSRRLVPQPNFLVSQKASISSRMRSRARGASSPRASAAGSVSWPARTRARCRS